jgi:hypothetical protein
MKRNEPGRAWFAAMLSASTFGAFRCAAGDPGQTPQSTDDASNRPVVERRDSSGSSSIEIGSGASFVGATSSTTTLDPPSACAGETYRPERLPLDMYFLVDSSGSMALPTAGGTKWDMVRSALVNFLGDPENADVGVGLGYFPTGVQTSCVAGDPDCLCIPFTPFCFVGAGGACEATAYSQAAVPLSLPPTPSALISDLNAHLLAGGTPTRPALEGALQYVQTWANEHPGRRVVVVLATDGEPAGCLGNSPNEVASIAAAALNGPSQIKTFVIGVGRSLDSLNLVAAAGGTTQAFLTDTGSNLVSELADALGRIRTSALPCAYTIPIATSNGSIDPSRTNVLLTPEGAGAPRLIPKVASGREQDCDGRGGWYYDNPSDPAQVQLCPASCAETYRAQVDVEFGCDTVIF